MFLTRHPKRFSTLTLSNHLFSMILPLLIKFFVFCLYFPGFYFFPHFIILSCNIPYSFVHVSPFFLISPYSSPHLSSPFPESFSIFSCRPIFPNFFLRLYSFFHKSFLHRSSFFPESFLIISCICPHSFLCLSSFFRVSFLCPTYLLCLSLFFPESFLVLSCIFLYFPRVFHYIPIFPHSFRLLYYFLILFYIFPFFPASFLIRSCFSSFS